MPFYYTNAATHPPWNKQNTINKTKYLAMSFTKISTTLWFIHFQRYFVKLFFLLPLCFHCANCLSYLFVFYLFFVIILNHSPNYDFRHKHNLNQQLYACLSVSIFFLSFRFNRFYCPSKNWPNFQLNANEIHIVFIL